MFRACSKFLGAAGRKLQLMEHAQSKTQSLCIEGYKSPGTVSTTSTSVPTRNVPAHKVKGTIYTIIRDTPGYSRHNDTSRASKTLSQAEHCLTVMTETDQVSVKQEQALTFTKILRALVATLVSTEDVSTSAVYSWVIQDIKVLLKHFSGNQQSAIRY